MCGELGDQPHRQRKVHTLCTLRSVRGEGCVYSSAWQASCVIDGVFLTRDPRVRPYGVVWQAQATLRIRGHH